MEELIQELEKLSKAYVDTPENEEKVLIPFIKKLLERPVKERRKLIPKIRELEYVRGYSWMTSCDPARRRFLAAVEFVSVNKREMMGAYDIDFGLLCKLLPLYCPTWLTDFINESNTWGSFNLSYEEHLQLMDMGYLKEFAPIRIAKTISGSICIKSKKTKGKVTYDSNLLLKRDITLKEHIWTIFEHESSVAWIDDSVQRAYKEGITTQDESISTALYRFSLSGHLDRNRLLKATLSTFHRDFKKDMASWFSALFEKLQPTIEELLSLQEEMMQVFTSPYTKPINVMLQQLKKLATEEGFRYQEFIERATPLLFSCPKNSLTIIYAIFEQIAKYHPEMKESCCLALCQLFLRKDESLQKKTADFILKYGNPSSSVMIETLQPYQPEMFQSVQGLLASFMTSPAQEETILEEEQPSLEVIRICRDDNRILYPANKEDFLFQLSRLFDMDETAEIDATISSFITFHPQLDEDDFSRMTPIFQRAYDIIANSWRLLDSLLATFLLEYARLWLPVSPSISDFLENIFAVLKEKDANRGRYDERSFLRLADWKTNYSESTCFEPIKQLWLEVIRKIKDGDSLLLLSTPTHAPAYVQSTVLVERLTAYQKAKVHPSLWDFQLAIARCAPDDKEEAVTLARQQLKDEYLHLCLFLLEENTQPQPPYEHPSVWLTAGLVKSPDTEFEAFKSFSCYTLPNHYLTGDYDWKGIQAREHLYEPCLLDLDFQKWKVYLEHNSHQLWQEHLIVNSKYVMDDSTYMERLFCCFPNRPEPLIAQIICCYMNFNTPQEDNKRTIACALRMLLSFHCPLREMSLLLLAGSLLFVDKTVRSYAAELWVEGIRAGRINNRRLGEILARIINMNIVPLKRFTTEVYESMYKRSTFHNRQLEELLTVMLCGLNDTPVTGQKQLLELYLELLHVNGSRITHETVRQRLEVWKKNSNLKKVATALNNI